MKEYFKSPYESNRFFAIVYALCEISDVKKPNVDKGVFLPAFRDTLIEIGNKFKIKTIVTGDMFQGIMVNQILNGIIEKGIISESDLNKLIDMAEKDIPTQK